VTWKRGNRLKLMNEVEAPARTVEIFSEVCRAFGGRRFRCCIGCMRQFRVFSTCIGRCFVPRSSRGCFFVLGARLAAESYTRAHNYFVVPRLPGQHAIRPRPSESPTWLPLPQVLD